MPNKILTALEEILEMAAKGTPVIVGAKSYKLAEAPPKATAVYVRARITEALEGK